MLDEARSECDAERIVDAQRGDGDAADWGAAEENGAIPAKVPLPLMTSGIEERSLFTSARIQAGDVRTLK